MSLCSKVFIKTKSKVSILSSVCARDLALGKLLEFICLCSLLSSSPCSSISLEHDRFVPSAHGVPSAPEPHTVGSFWSFRAQHKLSHRVFLWLLSYNTSVLPKSFSSTSCHFTFLQNSSPADIIVIIHILSCVESGSLMRSWDLAACLSCLVLPPCRIRGLAHGECSTHTHTHTHTQFTYQNSSKCFMCII